MKKLTKLLAILLATLCLFGATACKDKSKVITVGASEVPHSKILEVIKDDLAEKGYTLEIKVFDDYVLPNLGVDDGTLLANFFQHEPYLNEFNQERKTDLVSVKKVHYEAFAIYSEKVSAVADVPADAKVAIPDDVSNGARALYLLQEAGLIKLKDDAGINAGVEDIIASESKLSASNIKPMEASLLPNAVKDGAITLAVINGNYALTQNVTAKALQIEGPSISATEYANIICVKKGNENDPRVKALIEAITSQKVKDFIDEKYDGFVVPVF